MIYARLYADRTGESHFEDVELETGPAEITPPAPPVTLSEMMAAEHVGFLSFPPGWSGGFQVAPSRMILFVLDGQMELTASDGVARRFPAGSVFSVEDTEGKGHAMRVIGEREAQLAFAGLPNGE